ncbi:MAG: imidazole glycerol phosphate synthase subunit HisF [Bradymonadia bacterium]
MLTSRIIPCLDVRNGRVVKGVKFQNLRDTGCPIESAKRYADQGADELVMLDISATLEERATTISVIEGIRTVLNIPLTVGGGIRSIDDARRLLSAGADKISVNSAAVTRPALITQLNEAYGRQCTVVAVDAIGRGPNQWEVLTRSGTFAEALDAVQWMARAEALGAGEILLTSFDRDGTREGYDLELLSAAANALSIPVIASGGANSAVHMLDALHAGASAVLAASIFHDGDTTIQDVKTTLRQAGVRVRL